MVFGFLGDIAKTVGDIGQVVTPVQQILTAIRGPQPYRGLDPFDRPVPQAEQYATQLLSEIARPDSELLERLQAEESEGMLDAFRSGIRSKTLAERRERALGRAPTYFDPERADETISFQLSRAMPQIRNLARQAAIQRIQQAATGVGGYAGAQEARTQRMFEAAEAGKIAEAQAREALPQNIDALRTGIEQFANIFRQPSRVVGGVPIPGRKPYSISRY